MNSVVTNVLAKLDLVVRLVVGVLLLIPAAVIAFLSFSGERNLAFPPREWGTLQYESFLGSAYWLHSVWLSLLVAVPTATLAVVIGVPAAYALNRTSLPFRGLLTGLGLAPLVMPGVAYAVAMYTFYIQIGILGSTLGLILAHTVLAIPFVILIVGAAIVRIPPEMELVAMTLGASRFRATTGITFRLLLPAMAASFLLAFITSFDEAVFVNFLGGPGLITLPKAIFDSVRTGLEPLITAIGTILMILTGGIMLLITFLRRGTNES